MIDRRKNLQDAIAILKSAGLTDAKAKGALMLTALDSLLSEIVDIVGNIDVALAELKDRATAPAAAVTAGSADVASPFAGISDDEAFDKGKAAAVDGASLGTCPYQGGIGAHRENHLRRTWFAGYHGEEKPAATA